jgi:hypothetical protein
MLRVLSTGETFPKLSDAKLKGGVFIGPQIPEIINPLNTELNPICQ